MTNSILSLCFGICLGENDQGFKKFTLDELIVKTRELFELEGLPGFMEMILKCAETMVLESLIGKSVDPTASLKELTRSPCCEVSLYESSGFAKRKMSTTLGKVKLNFTRIRCQGCRASFVPMSMFLGLEKFQNKSHELTKVLIESVVDQSYRRSLSQVTELTGATMGVGTLWRAVMRNKSFDLSLRKKDLNSSNIKLNMDQAIREWIIADPLHAILADGTGFKLQKDPNKELNELQKLKQAAGSDSKFTQKSNPLLSEVRVIFGITKAGEVLPLGTYTEKESWKKIGRDLHTRFGKHPKLKPEPIAEVLVSDGEEGIFKGLGHLARSEQRCQWHLTSEFKGVFQYQDDGKKSERKIYQGEIQETIDKVHAEAMDKEKIKDALERKLNLEKEIIDAEKKLNELANKLEENNYGASAVYLRNSIYKIFTYLRIYMRTGILGPKVTSRLERLMREIGRRIKRIAYNWSAKGAALMTYLILVRCMNRKLWDKYWEKFLNATGDLKLTLEYAFMKKQEQSLLH